MNTSRMNENPNMYTARASSRGGKRGGHGSGQGVGHGSEGGQGGNMFNGLSNNDIDGWDSGGQVHHSHHSNFRGAGSSSSGIPAATPRVGGNNMMMVRAPVSPLGFDLDEVPCWNSNVSIPSDNLHSSTSHQQRDSNKPSFLPGLLNSKRLEKNIRMSGTGDNNSNPATSRLQHPVTHQKNPNSQPVRDIGDIKNIPAFGGNGSLPQHGRGGNTHDGKRGLFQSGQKTYQVEGAPGMHGGQDNYARSISTAAPALASASRYGGSSSRNHDGDRGDRNRQDGADSGELPVEPWAYRIIEKYNSSGSRPVSRTSSRISRAEMMQINNSQKGGNPEAIREDLLRVKSLGRFTKS
jgi:hypothetical protein